MSIAKKARVLLSCLMLIMGIGQAQTRSLRQDAGPPEAFCRNWRPGDHLVEFGTHLAILGGTPRILYSHLNYPVSDAMGCLVSLVPAGQGVESDLCIGAPYLKLRDKREDAFYARLEQVEEGESSGVLVMRAQGDYSGPRGEKAVFVTTYRFHAESGLIELESEITNSGDRPMERFSYALYYDAGTGYHFSPFDKDVFPELNFRISGRPGHALAWIDRNPVGESPPPVLAPGESRRVAYALMVDSDTPRLLDRVYRELGLTTHAAGIRLDDHDGDLAEIIVREAVSQAVFYRTFQKTKEIGGLPLPAGTYQVQAHLFPAVVLERFTVAPEGANLCTLQDEPKGSVAVRIRDGAGNLLPGKVTFLGIGDTPSPYFQPEDPIATGRRWETVKNSCFPVFSESEIDLPVGSYLTSASYGPEYSRDQRLVEILRGDRRNLEFILEKTVDTSGLISIDPHMHTQHSDGRMKVPARLLSVAAEGVEIAVSADHNTVIDYRPALEELGLADVLGFITGNEVTVGGMIHYNTFPLAYREEAPHHGAIDPRASVVTTLFERSRENDPGTLIQVNHPRAGTIGYFNQHGLDPETAAFALKGFDLNFDVLEILNGPYRHGGNASSIKDWLNLINRGHFFPLTGSSDSHGIDGREPGFSRTYLKYSGGKGRDLDETAVIRALKAGRSFATNGPLVDVIVNDEAGMGETCTDRDGEVDVRVRVQSAPWVSVNEIRLLVNGRSRIGLPVPPSPSGALDLVRRFEVRLKRDAALVVEVLGHHTLYPVMQRTAVEGRPDRAVLPYALTNPVFVDVDGNGRFDPPLPGEIRLLDKLPDEEIKEK